MNNNTDLFELIECEIDKILLENDQDYIVSIIADNAEYGIPINGYDGTILTFVDTGCALNAHINTIHQIFLNFKFQCGFELSRVIIEAKHGDIIYCRLHWSHKQKNKDLYNIVSIGDALIINSLTKCPMYITKFVLNQFEPFDSEGYMHSYEN